MAAPVSPPFPLFTDQGGNPLEGGYIYFGQEGLNPETDPIPVYWDAEETNEATNPVRTISGYIVNNGNAAILYANGPFSITIKDRNGVVVFTSPSSPPLNNIFPWIKVDGGDEDEPGVRIGGDNTGFYYAEGVLGVSVNGTTILEMDDSQVNVNGDLVIDGELSVGDLSAALIETVDLTVTGTATVDTLIVAEADLGDIDLTGTFKLDGVAGTEFDVPTMGPSGKLVWGGGVGLIRAWVCFDGTGPTVLASSNVSGITDNGTGDYTINFTTPISDNKYAVFGSHSAIDEYRAGFGYGISQNPYAPYAVEGTYKLVGSCRIATGTGLIAIDPPSASFMVVR